MIKIQNKKCTGEYIKVLIIYSKCTGECWMRIYMVYERKIKELQNMLTLRYTKLKTY